MSKLPNVYVCKGSHCSKGKCDRRGLLDALDGVARVRTVGCQKVCRGPVAGLEVDGCLEWFADLGSDKARRRLVKLIRKGRIGKGLEKRRAKHRSGQRR
jgi:hypothetical protein